MTTLVPIADLAVSKYADNTVFNQIASSASFLPRLMLMNSSSNPVKEGRVNQGCFAIIKGKELIDLTKEVPVLPLSWRPKALEISNGEVVSAYDPNSVDFKKITEKSELPDSGCMYGPEFLLWVPSAQMFAGYFMASATSRREAPALKDLICKAALLKSTLIKGKKHSWFGPVVTICSSVFEIPELALIQEQQQLFANPPEVEKVDEAAEERVR